ncbi:hypothetical protein S7711_04743 [Stachybotrys chartarum IBT 7711]|uniref:Uncharacterized protein n=1 Tax=Stachybotrys chartarum (strain CBS 109288 / IBT 7711) TaxID=1280523 RepID=A0A084ASC7_STACB|nr:hypothetical protein S7711_04743 [Stachybotrys chartarum IBT 7711]KFA56309.1 hypothetical protein S40293_08275 [Stachybotrys chartarum IBT 40293]KFA81961.1 hypothetical protein S40288_04376 [Stachybotrys chartarum IBT 40288]
MAAASPTASPAPPAGSGDSDLLTRPAAPQDASPLFRRLPAEVRRDIFSLALAEYPDPSPAKQYGPQTCYTRPAYSSPRRCDTALLRTCRAVYREAWFLPFTQHELTAWLTHPERAPPEYNRARPTQAAVLRAKLRRIAAQLGQPAVKLDRVRFFAQMFRLEEGAMGDALKDMAPLLHFGTLTLTIRHADWWDWEKDEPLRFAGGEWMRKAGEHLPPTVREVAVELESVKRKEAQVDAIAAQMAERWFFLRSDGAALLADTTPGAAPTSRWRGSSTWDSKRWVRDETEENVLDLYVVTVRFLLLSQVERRGGKVSEEARAAAARGEFDAERMRLWLPGVRRMVTRGRAWIRPGERRRPEMSVGIGAPATYGDE